MAARLNFCLNGITSSKGIPTWKSLQKMSWRRSPSRPPASSPSPPLLDPPPPAQLDDLHDRYVKIVSYVILYAHIHVTKNSYWLIWTLLSTASSSSNCCLMGTLLRLKVTFCDLGCEFLKSKHFPMSHLVFWSTSTSLASSVITKCPKTSWPWVWVLQIEPVWKWQHFETVL